MGGAGAPVCDGLETEDRRGVRCQMEGMRVR
mgnify:CR=1 FL=1